MGRTNVTNNLSDLVRKKYQTIVIFGRKKLS